jgi:gamma-glutamyl phosphate reductase
MIRNIGIGDIRSILTSAGLSDKGLAIKAGTVVKAQVVDVAEGGNVMLRLISAGGSREGMQGIMIKAFTEVPLAKGQNIYLEVLGGKDSIRMQFIGEMENAPAALQQKMPGKILEMLVRFSEARLSNPEIRELLSMLKSLPDSIRTTIPELVAGNMKDAPAAMQQKIPVKILDMLIRFSEGRIGNSEIRELMSMLRALPDSIRTAIPELIVGNLKDVPAALQQKISEKILDMLVRFSEGKLSNSEIKELMSMLKSLPDSIKTAIPERVVSNIEDPTAALQQKIPVKILDMLARLSEARLSNSEFKELLSMLKSLPDSIKTAIPELKGLEKLMPDAKELNGNVIRAFVETSGVAFETKLKVAVLRDPESVLRNIIALQSDGDLKGLLLKLDSILKDPDMIQTLKQAGFKASDMSDMVERFVRNIEFFQLTSKVNDMFYTFMPALWEGLKDGEFLFKKNKGRENDSYACDINLDLERLGKLSVSVTSMEKAFYVSFFIEQPEVAAIVASEKKALQERFALQGLTLKAITINQKKKIDFGKVQNQGINITI